VNGLNDPAMGRTQRMNGFIELQNIIYCKDTNKLSRKKALAVMMKMAGVEVGTISEVTGASTRRIYEYLKQYDEAGGLKSIVSDLRYRPVSDLMKYKDEIKEEFTNSPPATANEASERVAELYGVRRSPTQIRSFLHKIGMKPLMVGHLPAKADLNAQKAFLEDELEPVIHEAQEGKRAILFLDASHMIWQVYLGILWCFSRVFVPAASGRVRINILGAYDPIRNELIRIINRTYITSTTICEMLIKIKEQYKSIPVSIVLDNARYQKCALVAEKARELGIHLLYLPSYAPNLNLIERLWRYVKKDCLYSKYYDTSAKFEAAIEACLDEISNTKKERIQKLMTLKFQLFDEVKMLKSA
jgi:transposase